jgi:hypothetical protein
MSRKLQAAEAEIVRLRLRIDGRPVPYYTVLKEFFPSKNDKFMPPDHICTCNICCQDLSQIKEATIKECMQSNEQRYEPRSVETKTTIDSSEH